MVFIDQRALRYTKGFNSPCSNLASEGTKSGVEPPLCPVLVLWTSSIRTSFWERNPLHLLSHGDFTQTDIKTGNMLFQI